MAEPISCENTDKKTASPTTLLSFSALQRDVIRVTAFLAMAGDHVATAFSPGMPLLHLAGRCAFPLFALMAGCNLAGRTLCQSSLNRLWLTALIAQPCFWLAFRDAGLQWWQLNILFTFAAVMQGAKFMQNATVTNGLAALAGLVLYLPLSSASYGLAGVLMLAGAFLVWQVRPWLQPGMLFLWLLLVALLNARHGESLMLAGVLLTLAVLFCVKGLVPPSARRLRFSGGFAPAYALHLMLIAAVMLL